MKNDDDKPTMMVAMVGEGGETVFAHDDSPELPDNIEDGVREDGTVDDHDIETYYHSFLRLIDGPGYLRVVADDDFVNCETRIPYSYLEAAGWRKS